MTRKLGPLPVWAWAAILIVLFIAYKVYKNNKAATAAQAAATQNQPNLGTTPTSNLTTQAQPMPIQLGDTYINTNPPSINANGGAPNTTLVQGGSADSMTPGGPNPPEPTGAVNPIPQTQNPQS